MQGKERDPSHSLSPTFITLTYCKVAPKAVECPGMAFPPPRDSPTNLFMSISHVIQTNAKPPPQTPHGPIPGFLLITALRRSKKEAHQREKVREGEPKTKKMGIVTSKCCTKYHETCRELIAKIQMLEEEMKEMKRAREQEARVYEQQAAVFARKEDEWKRERMKHKEEVATLRKMLEEEENRMRSLEEEVAASRGDKEWNRVGTEYIMEHMKEEQAQREEAVEKWKQLYLAIKTELDDLIQRTRQGNVAASCLDTSEICTKNLTSNASSCKSAKIYANFTLVACAWFMLTLSETGMASGWCKEGNQVHTSHLQALYMINLAKFTQAKI